MGGPAAGELTRSVYYITTTRRLSTSSITTLPRRRLSDLHQLAVIIQKQPPGRITVKGGGEPEADVRYFIFVLRRAILLLCPLLRFRVRKGDRSTGHTTDLGQ